MADLNKVMQDIQKSSADIEKRLKDLFGKYEILYRDGNKEFINERISSNGSMEGLEDFRRLVLIIKRNKDVVASLLRGVDNLRSIKEFKFVEEEIPAPKPKKKRKKTKPKTKAADTEFDSVMSDIIEPETLIPEDK